MVTWAQPKPKQTRAEPSSVRLRALREGDKVNIRRWMADIDIVRFTVMVPGPDCQPALPYDEAAADRYARILLESKTRRSFAICVDGAHVGNVGLKDLDPNARRSECFVEVCEARFRRRGVARAAMLQVLDFAFLELGLIEVSLGVFEFNFAARRLYEGLGFGDAGHYGWHYANDNFCEVLKMSINIDGWAAARMPPDAP